MKVIMAGYSKTGTKTMNEALTKLGFKTYDLFEHWWFHGKNWIKIFNEGGTTEDFYEMYKDVDAIVDTPAFYFWEEIHKAFPEAKIIFTTREEDRWFPSYAKQIADNSQITLDKIYFLMAAVGLNPFKIMHYMMRYIKPMYRIVFSADIPEQRTNEIVSRMLFRQHNAYVLQKAPKDKLLVYKVSDGWEPLCRFLEKDVPDCPFPHKNKNATLVAEILAENPIASANLKVAKRNCCIILIILLCVILAVVLGIVLWQVL